MIKSQGGLQLLYESHEHWKGFEPLTEEHRYTALIRPDPRGERVGVIRLVGPVRGQARANVTSDDSGLNDNLGDDDVAVDRSGVVVANDADGRRVRLANGDVDPGFGLRLHDHFSREIRVHTRKGNGRRINKFY